MKTAGQYQFCIFCIYLQTNRRQRKQHREGILMQIIFISCWQTLAWVHSWPCTGWVSLSEWFARNLRELNFNVQYVECHTELKGICHCHSELHYMVLRESTSLVSCWSDMLHCIDILHCIYRHLSQLACTSTFQEDLNQLQCEVRNVSFLNHGYVLLFSFACFRGM